MQCGGCGTILKEGQLTCPNCGRMVWSRGGSARTKPSKLPGPGDSASRMDDVEELELSEPADDTDTDIEASTGSGASGVSPDPRRVRDLVAGDPELLEKGLTLLHEKNKPVGVGYATDVGSIDILARDSGGGLVVVMVTKGSSGSDIVAEVLQRIGWVRKHVAKTREGVRGIVVMDQAPDNLSYAAAAVADTVAFRTYRMTLTFDEVEL